MVSVGGSVLVEYYSSTALILQYYSPGIVLCCGGQRTDVRGRPWTSVSLHQLLWLLCLWTQMQVVGKMDLFLDRKTKLA